MADEDSLEEELERELSDTELASYLMYPDVFRKFAAHNAQYGKVSDLPTHVFFYGMESGTEITLPVMDGRNVIIRYLAASQPDEDGMCRVFFEVNGQPQTVIASRHDARSPAIRIDIDRGGAE